VQETFCASMRRDKSRSNAYRRECVQAKRNARYLIALERPISKGSRHFRSASLGGVMESISKVDPTGDSQLRDCARPIESLEHRSKVVIAPVTCAKKRCAKDLAAAAGRERERERERERRTKEIHPHRIPRRR